MNNTKIEWCDSTCNPVCGCTFGCEFCYARRINNRFHYIENFAEPQFFPGRLKQLYSKKPKNIFMDSMSDIADWEDEWIAETFKAMEENPQHNYLFLTKRISDIVTDIAYNPFNFLTLTNGMKNVWVGSTITNISDVEERDYVENNFLSIEPLHEGVSKALSNVNHHYYGWIIIGAETGNRKKKVIPKPEWVEQIVSECDKHSIPVFMKESLVGIVGEENMRRELPEGLKK